MSARLKLAVTAATGVPQDSFDAALVTSMANAPILPKVSRRARKLALGHAIDRQIGDGPPGRISF